MNESWRGHASVERLTRIATALGPLSRRVVYIGGAVAPILQLESPFPTARITKEVDAVAATASAVDHAALHDELRRLGFREATSERHAHRWIAPDGSLFDLVPAGDHLGATGQAWDRIAVVTAVDLAIDRRITIRHASAPAFLALKWAAFADRGAADPFASHDLEDIIGVVVSRPAIAAEVAADPVAVQEFLRERFTWLAVHPDFDDLLAANLSTATDRAEAAALAKRRILDVPGSLTAPWVAQ